MSLLGTKRKRLLPLAVRLISRKKSPLLVVLLAEPATRSKIFKTVFPVGSLIGNIR